MAINHTEQIPMSDTQSIYKSVLGLNETGGSKYLTNPSITTHVWTTTNYFHPLGCTAQSGSSVIIQTMWRLPVFNPRLHLRLIVESVIQNGCKPGLSEQPAYIKNKCYTNTTYASFQFRIFFYSPNHIFRERFPLILSKINSLKFILWSSFGCHSKPDYGFPN